MEKIPFRSLILLFAAEYQDAPDNRSRQWPEAIRLDRLHAKKDKGCSWWPTESAGPGLFQYVQPIPMQLRQMRMAWERTWRGSSANIPTSHRTIKALMMIKGAFFILVLFFMAIACIKKKVFRILSAIKIRACVFAAGLTRREFFQRIAFCLLEMFPCPAGHQAGWS